MVKYSSSTKFFLKVMVKIHPYDHVKVIFLGYFGSI